MARFDRLEFGDTRDAKSADSQSNSHANDAAPADALPDVSFEALRNADLNRRKGLYENALRQYSRALELEKSLIAGWVGQLQMLVLIEEAPEADVWGRKALELFPGNGELLAARAQAVCRVGDIKQAHALADAAMAAPGRTAYRWQVRGEVLLANRQEMEQHCFSKARECDSDWLVSLETALIYLRYRFPAKATIAARAATELAPDQPYAWYVQGLSEMELDQSRLSRQCFERCLQLSPHHAEAKKRLLEVAKNRWSIGRLVRRVFRPR